MFIKLVKSITVVQEMSYFIDAFPWVDTKKKGESCNSSTTIVVVVLIFHEKKPAIASLILAYFSYGGITTCWHRDLSRGFWIMGGATWYHRRHLFRVFWNHKKGLIFCASLAMKWVVGFCFLSRSYPAIFPIFASFSPFSEHCELIS